MNHTIAGVLQTLATKLGVAITYLWGILVKQAVLIGYENLAWCGLFVLLDLFCIVMMVLAFRHVDDTSVGGWDFTAGFCLFGLIVFIILAGVTGCHALNDLFNPGYKAMQMVLNQIQ